MIKLFFFILLSPCLFCQDVASLLPDGFAGWEKSGEPELYKGTDLYKLIDGGADIFFEYGFVQAVRQSYNNNDDNITDIEIYEMRDSAASYGIFSLFTYETGEPVDSLSDAYGGDGFLLLRKGRYYIGITSISSTTNSAEDLMAAAKIISKQISAAGIPSIVSIYKDSADKRIVYIKGTLGLYNLSPVNFGSNLNFREAICFQDHGGRAFLISFENNEECGKNFISALKCIEADKSYKAIINEKSRALFNGNYNIEINTKNEHMAVLFLPGEELKKKEPGILK